MYWNILQGFSALLPWQVNKKNEVFYFFIIFFFFFFCLNVSKQEFGIIKQSLSLCEGIRPRAYNLARMNK